MYKFKVSLHKIGINKEQNDCNACQRPATQSANILCYHRQGRNFSCSGFPQAFPLKRRVTSSHRYKNQTFLIIPISIVAGDIRMEKQLRHQSRITHMCACVNTRTVCQCVGLVAGNPALQIDVYFFMKSVCSVIRSSSCFSSSVNRLCKYMIVLQWYQLCYMERR